MNELPPAKRRAIKHLLAMGASRRAIAAAVGCSTNTVKRYAKVWTFSPICACGKPAGHNGWCHARLEFSPARRGWLADHWGKRGSSEVAAAVDEGCRRAAGKGHTLGRFVWASAVTSALAYATCVECGQSVRVNDGGLRRDRLDGSALTRPCLSDEQRAANRAARQEMKEWRKAKRTVAAIKRRLHPRSSRTAASPLAPTSRA